MSLSREQWEQMWESIKLIERKLNELPLYRRQTASEEIKKIKNQIQSVIGQQE